MQTRAKSLHCHSLDFGDNIFNVARKQANFKINHAGLGDSVNLVQVCMKAH